MIFVLLALAIAPGLGIMFFIYFKDKYEKEPFHLMLKCFLFGILAIIPAVIVELASGLDGHKEIWIVAIYAFCIVGFSEEFSKYFFLRVFAFRKKDFNEPFDGIVYSVMISMGFATAENILYVLQGGLSVGLLRMFTAVPAHASFAILMGYFVGLAKFKEKRFLYLSLGLFSAVIFHGLYDFFLIQEDYNLLKLMAFVALILAIVLSFKAMKINRELSPFKNGPVVEPATTEQSVQAEESPAGPAAEEEIKKD
jgi:protease PrsW